jgi:hypothetical protein
MVVTDKHVQDINEWLQQTLARLNEHFLTGLEEDWMLYGTGTAQLPYLAVLDAVAEFLIESREGRQPGPVVRDRITYRHQQISGRKEVLPNVSNYSIQFTDETVEVERTKKRDKPIRLLGGTFPTPHSMDFFESFNDSPFSLNNLSYQKLVGGTQKDNQHASPKPKLKDIQVQGMIRRYAVRRACKFLLYESIGNGLTIRYVLDDLNPVMAATRAYKDDKVPVCTSEIREIFRCWDYFQTRVTFYEDFYRVRPPWEGPNANPDAVKAWAIYADRRAAKVLLGDTARVQPEVIQRLRECRAACGSGDWARAIGGYHASRPSAFGPFGSFVNVASFQDEAARL